MKDFFIELFEYSYICNQKLADIFTTYPTQTSERATQLYNHILNAHQIWNCRIERNQNEFGIWEIHLLQSYAAIDKMNYENSLLILDKHGLNDAIHYKGKSLSNSVRDILFHVINHSTYHRGQIATEFRLNGLEPLTTGYIFFKR